LSKKHRKFALIYAKTTKLPIPQGVRWDHASEKPCARMSHRDRDPDRDRLSFVLKFVYSDKC
jgi:hypothetical protein